jgi:hypothetical protein
VICSINNVSICQSVNMYDNDEFIYCLNMMRYAHENVDDGWVRDTVLDADTNNPNAYIDIDMSFPVMKITDRCQVCDFFMAPAVKIFRCTCIEIEFKKCTKPPQSIFQPLGIFPSQRAFDIYFKHRERGAISAVCKDLRCIAYSESDFCSSVRNCFVFFVPLYSTSTIIFALKSKLCHAMNIEEANYFL